MTFYNSVKSVVTLNSLLHNYFYFVHVIEEHDILSVGMTTLTVNKLQSLTVCSSDYCHSHGVIKLILD